MVLYTFVPRKIFTKWNAHKKDLLGMLSTIIFGIMFIVTTERVTKSEIIVCVNKLMELLQMLCDRAHQANSVRGVCSHKCKWGGGDCVSIHCYSARE